MFSLVTGGERERERSSAHSLSLGRREGGIHSLTVGGHLQGPVCKFNLLNSVNRIAECLEVGY